MMFSDNFPWEVREDASTISRFKELEADPERMRKARECIQHTVTMGNKALGHQVPPPTPGRKNPATIMMLEGYQQKRR